ncbi:MAG: DUF6755 family protein [Candidatus Obscuribacterales bacterium]|nr:hypothetical protein [Cyanobacteria bacterium SZAS LIN-5]
MIDRNNATQRNARNQYMVAINGALALTAVLLTVQMWLLTASLEATLSGHRDSALPGAIFSGLLFFATFGLYVFVRKLERHARDKNL